MPKKNKSNKSDFEDVKLIYEFKYNAVKETALILTKGVSFYLAIIAVLIGYVMTRSVSDDTKNYVILIVSFVSISVLISGIVLGWGVIKGLKSIEKILEYNNEHLFKKLEVDKFFNRGKLASKVVLVCVFLAVFIFALVVLNMDIKDLLVKTSNNI
ncbi:MAG: hypothetical protein AB8B78_02295 [Polaribacter sp.]